MWEISLVEEVEHWYLGLDDEADLISVRATINLLEQEGPTLGRPIVDRVKGSNLHNLKELRPSSTSIRILFVFDPNREAVLLVAGDKEGQWQSWYHDNIPVAEDRYAKWLAGEYDNDKGPNDQGDQDG